MGVYAIVVEANKGRHNHSFLLVVVEEKSLEKVQQPAYNFAIDTLRTRNPSFFAWRELKNVKVGDFLNMVQIGIGGRITVTGPSGGPQLGYILFDDDISIQRIYSMLVKNFGFKRF